MNPSLLTSSPSTPFLSPFPLKLAPSSLTLPKRHRFLVSFPRSSSAETPSTLTLESKPDNVFGGNRELTGIQPLVSNLSPPIRLASSAIILAGALAAGYGLGTKFGGGSRNLALGGAAVAGAAGGAVVFALNSAVPEVAAINLHNYVSGFDDPTQVSKEEIEGIAKKYGVSKQDEAFNAELCDLYSMFVSSVIPPGGEELTGNEVETIINFKNALGIDDPDAASMHVELGRRIFRQRLETGDRVGDVEQRRAMQAFQKLIYISTLVFGEASSFLLPWKRVFKVTDSQVEIAIRDNAQRLYFSKLKSVVKDIDVEQLVSLRQAQLSYRLSDELAEDLFRQHTRKLVEKNISAALDRVKSRTRTVQDVVKVVEELDKILAFNNKLISLKNHEDAASFACGVGPVSVSGLDPRGALVVKIKFLRCHFGAGTKVFLLRCKYDSEREKDDLKLLYRAYVTDALSGGRMEEHKLAALNQLKNIFGLGKREAESITLDITSKVYRKRLAQGVSSGDLEFSDSKAAFLQNLCEELHFDPQKATEIHEEIYRQKLQQCAADGVLSDEDVKALTRLRVMLCIPQHTIDAAHSDICGSLFEKVVKDAIASGVDGYDADVKKAVRKAAHGWRLTRESAMSIAGKAARRIFLNFVKQARMAENRTEGAKALRKLIAFNSLVVTELVADIKGESSDTPREEPSKVEDKKIEEEDEWDDEEWESLETLKKIRPSEEMIFLKERGLTSTRHIYFTANGEVTRIPFGAQITTKKDDSEYLLLNQLGGILGLTVKEIVEVHRSLAEQAFRQQAEVILADGQLTKARIEQLNELQKQVGLPPEYAQKVIKNITTTKMAAALETAINRGRLNMKQIRELKEASIDFNSMISEKLRENLHKKTVDEIFSSGTGEFDEEEVYEKIPIDLNINAEKAKGVVHELARSRLSNSLIQAVALLRQRNQQGVVSTLNDLLACDKAVPSEPLTWEVPEELADLYTIYMKNNPAPEKLCRLQYLLGISDSTATALGETKDTVFSVGAEEEKFVF
uniref:Protein TIC110, chloroplastic n=1 Tax=Salix viminalis TaxID=40686 RepID=A0A6N2LJ44_SALVM